MCHVIPDSGHLLGYLPRAMVTEHKVDPVTNDAVGDHLSPTRLNWPHPVLTYYIRLNLDMYTYTLHIHTHTHTGPTTNTIGKVDVLNEQRVTHRL